MSPKLSGRTSRRHPKGQPLIEPVLEAFQIEIDKASTSKTGVGSGATKPSDTAKDITKKDDQPDVPKAKTLMQHHS